MRNEQEQAEHDKRCQFNALDLLARRDHSIAQLRAKLQTREYSDTTIHAVLASLVEQGYLNDQRYAIAYAHYRFRKGYGPIYIENKLRQAGVSQEHLCEGIESIDQDTWLAQLRQVCEQKFSGAADSLAQKAKRVRFLLQRGFLPEQIYRVVNENGLSDEGYCCDDN